PRWRSRLAVGDRAGQHRRHAGAASPRAAVSDPILAAGKVQERNRPRRPDAARDTGGNNRGIYETMNSPETYFGTAIEGLARMALTKQCPKTARIRSAFLVGLVRRTLVRRPLEKVI